MRQTLRRIPTAHLLIVAILSLQYAVFQLATGVQYWDAPRNLHWGIYTAEQPRFLLDAEDQYDRINGYPPDPATLNPSGSAGGRSTPLHPWWGPLYVLIFAAVWRLTGSYTALALVVPLLAGAVVVLTYMMGRRLFNAQAGLIAAVLLAIFPIFREHAVMSFVEPISALLLLGAFWAFLEGRYAWVGAIGVLTVLGKVDLIPLYFGTLIGAIALSWRDPARPTLRQIALVLVPPALTLLPWLITIYVLLGRPTTVGGGPSMAMFRLLAPLVLDQFFLLPTTYTLVILALLVFLAGYALWCHDHAPALVYNVLGLWLGFGVAVLLFYMTMPGASNNPRVCIPALPALCLLVADGLAYVSAKRRWWLFAPILMILLFSSVGGMIFQWAQASLAKPLTPVWAVLREAPPGVILVEDYWNATLFTRHPVTWFAHDPVFERNILDDAANFQRYLAVTPIRYVVLPKDEAAFAVQQATLPAVTLYQRLIFRRDLELRSGPVAAPAVHAYLAAHFPAQPVGDYVIFTVR